MITISSKDIVNSPFITDKRRITVGSDPQNDIVINASSVDKYHAQIIQKEGIKILSPNGASVKIDNREILSEFVDLPCDVFLGRVCLHLSADANRIPESEPFTHDSVVADRKVVPPRMPEEESVTVKQVVADNKPKPMPERSKWGRRLTVASLVLIVLWFCIMAVVDTGNNPSKADEITDQKKTDKVAPSVSVREFEPDNSASIGAKASKEIGHTPVEGSVGETSVKGGEGENDRTTASSVKGKHPQRASIGVMVPDNYKEDAKILIRHLKSAYVAGKPLPEGCSNVKAFSHYSDLLNVAKEGDAEAQFIIGYLNHRQLGDIILMSEDEVIDWLTKSASQGYVEAQFSLGYCYDQGYGVKQDFAKAVQWYIKAALQGHAPAQFKLGQCCDSGRGVVVDRNKAAQWYTEAAKQGHATAQMALRVIDRKLKDQNRQPLPHTSPDASKQSIDPPRKILMDELDSVYSVVYNPEDSSILVEFDWLIRFGVYRVKTSLNSLDWSRVQVAKSDKSPFRGLYKVSIPTKGNKAIQYQFWNSRGPDFKTEDLPIEADSTDFQKEIDFHCGSLDKAKEAVKTLRQLAGIKSPAPQKVNPQQRKEQSLNEALKNFTTEFYKAGSSASNVAQIEFFAPSVDYFGEKFSLEQIRKDQQDYTKKWQQRDFAIESIKFFTNKTNTFVNAEVVFRMQLKSDSAGLIGRRSGTLGISVSGKRLQITSISSKAVGVDQKTAGSNQLSKPSIPPNAPKGTTIQKRNGKWIVLPPTVDFQEKQLHPQEIEDSGEIGGLGREYHVKHLTKKTSFDSSRDIRKIERLVEQLNKKENTTYYYVYVGTKY